VTKIRVRSNFVVIAVIIMINISTELKIERIIENGTVHAAEAGKL